ncbi:hypothetical protein [uncultured Limosilactobacillus sp.]|uniref:hypothetical protein n=1 Tax=uncultured Limosilactobacillus sp. TaxID=2837629 RepID=UPI0025E4AA68|nr:hypothetical protein [uncultured Limosilactobacillus sp.]
MTNAELLARIINSDYSTDEKVDQIINLYDLDRIQLLNSVSNQIEDVVGQVINLHKNDYRED